MTERIVEIRSSVEGISAKVVDENGNQLKPTEEEIEYITKVVKQLMFNDYISFEELGVV